jgi:hypothetical protein
VVEAQGPELVVMLLQALQIQVVEVEAQVDTLQALRLQEQAVPVS